YRSLTGAFFTSLVILAPITTLLGMATPLAVRLVVEDKNSSGSAAGNIYALSTIGSIIGTFSAGFWLIPNYGVHKILFGVSMALIISAIITASSSYIKFSILIVIFMLSTFYFVNDPKLAFALFYEDKFGVDVIADMDTMYNRIWIYDEDANEEDHVRTLANSQSSIYMERPIEDMLVFDLYDYFNLAPVYKRDINDALMIGGGAYTYATFLNNVHPDWELDVVEIDGGLLPISKEYFRFEESENFTNFAMDGRYYLNKNDKKYDVIFLDAYRNGDAMPFQLVTKEAYRLMFNSLNENGLLIINMLSTLDGETSKLFKSQYATLKTYFNDIKVFPAWSKNPYVHQNIVLIATKGSGHYFNNNLSGEHEDALSMEYLRSIDFSQNIVLTDDYAPVEYYDKQRILR
ncbi:fused MFS/spermidine synthase, partial [Patescibacteria group bacterium]